jgi:tetratricopeptide (TPR) repeat protein
VPLLTSTTARLTAVLIALLCFVRLSNAAEAVGPHPAAALIEKAGVTMRSEPEEGRRLAQEAVDLLLVRPDPDLEARARLMLCDFQSERNTALADSQIRSIADLLPRVKRKGLESGLYDCRGQIAEAQGDHAKARELYEQSVAIGEREHDKEMLAAGLVSRGYLMGLQGQYASGLTDLRRAEALFEEIHLDLHALTTLNGVAILYNRMGDYEQAKSIYDKALKQQRDLGLHREETVTLYNLGRVY